MRGIRGFFQLLTRPQLWVGVVAVGLLAVGVVTVPLCPPLEQIKAPVASSSTTGRQLTVISSAPPSSVLSMPTVNCAVVACIALTFDDGPDPAVTPRVLDILERHHAQATFFVLGVHVAGNEPLLRRMHQDGYEIGNHSWAHPHFPQLSPQQMQSEVSRTQQAIAGAGVPAPRLFRPPYGEVDDVVLANVPLTVVKWNIDPEDWNPAQYKHMLEHLATHAKPGGVIIMHDTEPTTADSLDQILNQLEASKYTFVTISQLLDLAPGQPGLYYGRWHP